MVEFTVDDSCVFINLVDMIQNKADSTFFLHLILFTRNGRLARSQINGVMSKRQSTVKFK